MFTQAISRTTPTTIMSNDARRLMRLRPPGFGIPRIGSATIGGSGSTCGPYSATSCASMLFSSADACPAVAFERRRPKTMTIRRDRSPIVAASRGLVRVGTQMSVRYGAKIPLKPRGATPTIV